MHHSVSVRRIGGWSVAWGIWSSSYFKMTGISWFLIVFPSCYLYVAKVEKSWPSGRALLWFESSPVFAVYCLLYSAIAIKSFNYKHFRHNHMVLFTCCVPRKNFKPVTFTFIAYAYKLKSCTSCSYSVYYKALKICTYVKLIFKSLMIPPIVSHGLAPLLH